MKNAGGVANEKDDVARYVEPERSVPVEHLLNEPATTRRKALHRVEKHLSVVHIEREQETLALGAPLDRGHGTRRAAIFFRTSACETNGPFAIALSSAASSGESGSSDAGAAARARSSASTATSSTSVPPADRWVRRR
jgi:hypothetical protein